MEAVAVVARHSGIEHQGIIRGELSAPLPERRAGEWHDVPARQIHPADLAGGRVFLKGSGRSKKNDVPTVSGEPVLVHRVLSCCDALLDFVDHAHPPKMFLLDVLRERMASFRAVAVMALDLPTR